MLSCPRAVTLAATLGLLAMTGEAQAQTPAPYPPSQPGVAPGYTPYGYAPQQPYAPYSAPVQGYLPPEPTSGYETKRRSPAMIGIGIGLLAVGTAFTLGGAAMYASSINRYYWYDCIDTNVCGNLPSPNIGGVAMMVLGAAGVAVGLPLMLVGLRKVPVAASEPKAAFVPDVRVGAGNASLSFKF